MAPRKKTELQVFGGAIKFSSFTRSIRPTHRTSKIGRRLGNGKFGRVFLARHRATSYICALKVLSKDQIISEGEGKLVGRELEIHSNLSHPSILRFLAWFHDEGSVYTILEYAYGGNLFSSLKKQPLGRFSAREAAQYVVRMVHALSYLHGKGIKRRDIKPKTFS
ncbi:kinase-like protein [Zopfia rhizophila CBS 207.26]|uniref:Kinase-like protein n=1 Tax=Zopfia rhizophila CBS 207.26 TaxID=1314779 RepID=A0A6A6E706_9PEZI|nr:kinase-like protein [Zopfia rhizophila CBS 207.26]